MGLGAVASRRATRLWFKVGVRGGLCMHDGNALAIWIWRIVGAHTPITIFCPKDESLAL